MFLGSILMNVTLSGRLLYRGSTAWTLLVLHGQPQHRLEWETTAGPCRGYSLAREARFIKKLVTGTKHSRRKWFGGEAGSTALKDMSFLMNSPSSSAYKQSTPKQKSGRVLRRVGVLSTVFMEHVTNLLATGEVSTEIHGLGMEVTQVKISSDFTCVNVYWYCSEPEKEKQLESILGGIGGHVRHILSQLRVIGEVPPIVFIKDTKYTRLMEVENILLNLDFGEDYEPKPLGHNYKVAMSAQQHKSRRNATSNSVSESLGQRLQAMEDGGGPCGEDEDSSVGSPAPPICPSSPAVRQDMLGLDWNSIMGAITLEVSKAKRREASRNSVVESRLEDSAPPRSRAELLEEVTRNVNRQKEFTEFLKQRRILRSKEEKRQSTEAKEREFLEQEKQLRRIEGIAEYREQNEPNEAEDYLEDEDEPFGYHNQLQENKAK